MIYGPRALLSRLLSAVKWHPWLMVSFRSRTCRVLDACRAQLTLRREGSRSRVGVGTWVLSAER